MDITQLSGVSSDYLNTFAKKKRHLFRETMTVSARCFSTAMKSVDETNDLQKNTAESEEEVRFALWGSRKST